MLKTNRLMQLMAMNRTVPREYRIENADSSDEATVYLYDVIGFDWWTGDGVTAKQFAKDLNAIKASKIHLRINSPGGDVFDARAMVTAIKEHPAKVIAHVDGLAASAASYIATACDEVEITQGAFLMIHNGWTLAMGDRHVMLDTASLLEKVDSSIVDDYVARTGIDRAELHAMMDDETWIGATDAVALGFANRISGSGEKDAGKKAKAWNLAAYERPPENIGGNQIVDQEAAHAERDRRLRLVAFSPA